MNRFYKQLLFILIIITVIISGGLIIRAVNNRGDDAYIYIQFDEGYGSTAYDSSENDNDGTIVNALWKEEDECKTGKCLYFDGDGDYVSIPDFSLE